MTAALATAARTLFAMRRPEARAAVTGTDEELVQRAMGGDRQAFDDLYRRHVDVVWRRLGRLIGPDPEREDLVQQIFFDVFRGLDRFRGEAAGSMSSSMTSGATGCERRPRRLR